MRNPSKIAANLAAAVIVASLFGTSAFAETRHRDETRQVDRSSRGYDRRNDRADVQRYDRGRAEVQQGYGRSRGYDRTDNRGYGRGSGAYDSRHSITMEGRVSRLEHQRGGYRVWLDRGGYSYWVPESRFNLWPFRIGASIRFGGAWDPLGYVNVYDMGPIGGPYYTSGNLRGVVESIDYRRGTAVVRDDISGGFVTIVLRGNDPDMGDLRPGDYVDLSGAWTRNGTFEAYNLENLQDGRYGSGYRN